ncbi:unnamed protein product [Leptosia nina]|uniref:Peptidase S1 domain-containing protein n=1 Tax=Leptosia nina TaxID=320188 RepID=A0AAV1J7J4_9NEOP
MFDTGYEQYLPIERVLTHPKFRGWTADLALVFTFASMVSDKPGRVVPLVSDNVKAAVDANVTVISWGRSKDEETVEQIYTPPAVESDESTEQSEETTSHESLEVPVVAKSRTRIYHERPRADAKDQYDLSEGDTVKTFSLKMDAYDFDVHRHETTTGLQGIPEISYEANNNSDFNSEEDRKIWKKTKEDSGAPAMRHGHLVAVTVGGAEFDGDNVAVAMKISCFCSWIAENLPDGGPNMQCCTNCCDLHTQQSLELSEEKTHRYVYRKRKKIL